MGELTERCRREGVHRPGATDRSRTRGPLTPGDGPRVAGEPTRSVALVGTYPPTRCGIATFTSNLRAAITDPATGGGGWSVGVVRVLDEEEPVGAAEVVAHWVNGDHRSLIRALDTLSSFDAVVLQHEYGIFGGADGAEVIELVEGLRAPLIAVLHTALPTPTPHQRAVLERVMQAAELVVVQSEAARRRILRAHGEAPGRVVVIPHGAAANFVGATDPDISRPAVLTWGLLGPGKGIEHGIDAVSRLAEHGRAPTYVVAGETHPKVRSASGERYRESLRARAIARGVADRVRLDDGYRDWESLRALVRSVDVVLLPYESRDQVSSGVLVEAIASGKPVVATRFPHAEELLAGGAGLLVEHDDVEAMAAALQRVLYEPGLAEQMGAAARRAAQPLLWPAVGAAYRTLIDQALEARSVA